MELYVDTYYHITTKCLPYCLLLLATKLELFIDIFLCNSPDITMCWLNSLLYYCYLLMECVSHCLTGKLFGVSYHNVKCETIKYKYLGKKSFSI